MLFDNCINSKKQGNIALGIAISHFISLGHTVSIPINDSQEYDLLVDIDDFVHKVQVKSTRCKVKSGNYEVELRSKGGTAGTVFATIGESTNIDILFIVTEENIRYSIPFMEISHLKKSITLGEKYSQFIV